MAAAVIGRLLLAGIFCVWFALRIPHPFTRLLTVHCSSCCPSFPCALMASAMEHVVAHVHGTDEQVDTQSEVETLRSRTHHSRRDIVCWHCSRRGHMRQRCFRRMRQHRKRKLHGTQMADATTIIPCTLFQRLLLDMSAVFHAIPHREWFSTYSAVRHDCADTDSLGSDVAGVGDVHLHFVDGASMVLHDVRHMPTITECLVSIPCLRDDGYAFMHTEHSWRIHRGSLVVARGACCGTDFPLFPSYIRAGAVYVVALPCREVERRRVFFQDAVSYHTSDIEPDVHSLSSERHVESSDSSTDALQRQKSDAIEFEPVVQRVCGVTHTDVGFSGDARLGQSRVAVTDLAGEPLVPEPDALFFDASDSFEVEDDLDTAVYDIPAVELAIAEIERLCSLESQQSIRESVQWPSDCSGADSSVLQSFSSYMPLPGVADMVPGHIDVTQAIPVRLTRRLFRCRVVLRMQEMHMVLGLPTWLGWQR